MEKIMMRRASIEIAGDISLLIAGVGASVFLSCAMGFGEPTLLLIEPVAIGIAFTAIPCLLLTRFVTQSILLAALGGAAISELLLALLCLAIGNQQPDSNGIILATLVGIMAFPLVVFGSLAFSSLGVSLWRKKKMTQPRVSRGLR